MPAEPGRDRPGPGRGLDYYTGIVFETTVNGWEKFGSVASGGRYDNLASLFTPRRLPGVGASIGLDRLLALLDEAGWLKSAATTVPVLVANFPGTDPAIAFRLAARLRAAGIGAEVYPDPIPIGKQMGYGSTRGHKLAVIVGPDEQARQVFNLRNLANAPGGQGARLVGAGRLGPERARDPQAGRGRLMSAPAAEPDALRLEYGRRAARGLVRGTRDWLPADYARLAALERQLARRFRPGGLRADADADPRIHRAARAQERRGHRVQALRAGRRRSGRDLPASRADRQHRARLMPRRRSRPPCPGA